MSILYSKELTRILLMFGLELLSNEAANSLKIERVQK